MRHNKWHLSFKYYRGFLTVLLILLLQLPKVALSDSAVLIKDVNPDNPDGVGVFQNHKMAALDGSLIFFGNDPTFGFEIWKSDGTEVGTMMVTDTIPGPDSHIEGFLVGMNFAQLGNALFYSGGDLINGSRELWMTDGTASGTVLVKDVYPGPNQSNPVLQTTIGNTVFFSGFDGTNGRELWKSDGTEAGTELVKDINPGSAESDLRDFTVFNGMLFFQADNGTNGAELWRSDGTAAGTVLVKDINLSGDGFFGDNDVLTVVGDSLFFAATDGVNGIELWKSDGTGAGTVLVTDIVSGSGSSDPFFSGNLNGILLFGADDGVNGSELWRSDGTAAGTYLVKDVNGGGDSSVPSLFVQLTSDQMIFAAMDGAHDRELWITDGTSVGTSLLKDVNNAGSSNPTPMAVVEGVLFFEADDGIHGDELWKTDGTTAGTVMVDDINPGPADGLAPLTQRFANVGGAFVFSAEGPSGWELYGVDSDDDALSDLGEASLGTDALDPDSDDDGIIDSLDPMPLDPDIDDDGIVDGEDPDLIADAVLALPVGVFASAGDPEGQRNAMLSRLADIEQKIMDGDIAGALRDLRNLRRHVDGCETAGMADRNDWISDCTAQDAIRDLIDLLIINISS